MFFDLWHTMKELIHVVRYFFTSDLNKSIQTTLSLEQCDLHLLKICKCRLDHVFLTFKAPLQHDDHVQNRSSESFNKNHGNLR